MTCKRRAVVSDHKLEDVIAQSSCAAYMSHNPVGWVYAVRRAQVCSESSPICVQVCSDPSLQAQAIHTPSDIWTCVGAIFVYSRNPTGDGKNLTLGIGQYYYGQNKCNLPFCGPNYCCCRVTSQ